MISHYTAYVQKNPARVADLAFTLSNRREHLPHRAFSIKSPSGQLTTSAPSKIGETPNIVMVFTGQGAQWPQMGDSMIHNSAYPAFKQRIQDLDSHLQALKHAPEWSIEEELLKGPDTSRLGLSELSQPLCTAIQVALVDTFASVGIHPTAVVGHSSGEVAAAYAAGAITANEAITIAFYRGQATKAQTRSGSMAVIGMSIEEVQEYVQAGVVVGCENSPKSVTLAGDTNAIANAVARIKNSHPDVLARQLKVDKAYHSHHMAEISNEFYALIEHEVSAKAPNKLFFSSVEHKLLTEAENFGSKYWQMGMQSPVLFCSAVSSILEHQIAKNMVLLEIGPHSALAGPLRQIQSHLSTSSPYISAFVRNQDSTESFLTAIGQLHVLNAVPGLEKIIREGSTLPDLPRYPWDHSKRFWYESRLSREWRHREYRYHDLLGVRVPESPDSHAVFRNLFHLNNAPWIRDHKVGDEIIFPFAGFIAMIGEAVRQLTRVNEAFKLRNMIVNTALVLKEGPVEIITSLHRHRLTDSLDSEWWEFTITSYNGASWTKHCSGEVRSQSERLEHVSTERPLVRKVKARRCYDSMAMSGLNFGPSFQRLDHVRSDTVTQKATSELIARDTDGKDYHLHPTVIDASLQLLFLAASKGYAEQITNMMVPTYIQEMSIYRCYENVQVQASASYTPNGSIVGSSQCITARGKVALRSSGIKLSVLDRQNSNIEENVTACAEWAPHVDFLDINTLIKPVIGRGDYMPALAELSHLCMIYTQRAIAELDTSIRHMHKYRSWIDRYLLSMDLRNLQVLDNNAIQQRVKKLVHQLSQTNGAYPAVGIEVVFNNIRQIFTGEADALGLLLADNVLTNIYNAMNQCDISEFINKLSHSKPNLHVLEIGAGTGGSTANILKLLTPGNRTLYKNYTFTDISSGFFVAARDRFANYPNIKYTTLDISKDPSEQGFDGHKYDLILATNVIHATASLNDSLRNVRKLLSPKGWFLLLELTPTSKWINYIFGTLAGWWYGDAEGRSDEPYISTERWAKELKRAGFRTPEAAVLDSDYPHQVNAMIVARPEIGLTPEKSVTLLTISESRFVGPLVAALENRGYSVYRSRFDEEPLPDDGQDVIALLDYEYPFFDSINNQRFKSFKKLAENLKERGILWVTRLSQAQCQDPRFGQIHGIARTIRNELLVNFAICEVDNLDVSQEKLIDVYENFQVRQKDETLKPESEYAIVDNTVQVERYYPFFVQNEQHMSDSNGGMALRTSKAGSLAALHWSYEDIKPLKGDDVEVDTYATGLNFKAGRIAAGRQKNTH
jgi:malonyl CoA-acyl carrier protein transacylase